MAQDGSKRPRKATGPDRPGYLDGADTDKVAAIVLALASEVASLRERLDTHERLAETSTAPTVAQVERYQADDGVDGARKSWRKGFIHRLFRVILEDIETAQTNMPPPAE